jgi:cytochrome c556
MKWTCLSTARAAGTLAALFGLVALVMPAAADVTLKNDDMVVLRQFFMRVNSANEGLLEQQAKGALVIPANQLKQIGETWGRMGKLLPQMFVKGSEGTEANSRAKPEIWSDAAGFKAKLDDYAAATAKFQQVANASGDKDAVNAAFAAINKACDDCHKGYRAPARH